MAQLGAKGVLLRPLRSLETLDIGSSYKERTMVRLTVGFTYSLL